MSERYGLLIIFMGGTWNLVSRIDIHSNSQISTVKESHTWMCYVQNFMRSIFSVKWTAIRNEWIWDCSTLAHLNRRYFGDFRIFTALNKDKINRHVVFSIAVIVAEMSGQRFRTIRRIYTQNDSCAINIYENAKAKKKRKCNVIRYMHIVNGMLCVVPLCYVTSHLAQFMIVQNEAGDETSNAKMLNATCAHTHRHAHTHSQAIHIFWKSLKLCAVRFK